MIKFEFFCTADLRPSELIAIATESHKAVSEPTRSSYTIDSMRRSGINHISATSTYSASAIPGRT